MLTRLVVSNLHDACECRESVCLCLTLSVSLIHSLIFFCAVSLLFFSHQFGLLLGLIRVGGGSCWGFGQLGPWKAGWES